MGVELKCQMSPYLESLNSILVCGDLHAKYHILEKVKEKAKLFDKVVFLGDYVDDWNTPPEVSYNLLNSLLEWKNSEPDKIVLLWGNHDLSEYLKNEYLCSGFNLRTSYLTHNLYSENEDKFQVAYGYGPLLFTHAGVTEGWLKNIYKNYGGILLGDLFADLLNHKCNIKNRPSVQSDIFHEDELSWSGIARGGSKAPSPIWADKSELEEDSLTNPIFQIVGHTPVETITIDDKKNLVFCDTHSTYRDGKNIGDNSLLQVKIKKGKQTCENYLLLEKLPI